MIRNDGVTSTLADWLMQLGGISADRLRMIPQPGTASLADCIQINESESGGLFELIDGVLVEKAVSYEASVVALTVARLLGIFVSTHKLGLVSGADGFFRLSSSTRGPDVAFLSAARLPDGRFPRQLYPEVAPNLAVEVLSPGNTPAEMARKRLEYFQNGVQLVWIVDCVHRSVAVFTSPTDHRVLGDADTIDGGSVLPGFSATVASFFSDLDIQVRKS